MHPSLTSTASSTTSDGVSDLHSSIDRLAEINRNMEIDIKQKDECLLRLQMHIADLERQLSYRNPLSSSLESQSDISEFWVEDHELILERMCDQTQRLLFEGQQAIYMDRSNFTAENMNSQPQDSFSFQSAIMHMDDQKCAQDKICSTLKSLSAPSTMSIGSDDVPHLYHMLSPHLDGKRVSEETACLSDSTVFEFETGSYISDCRTAHSSSLLLPVSDVVSLLENSHEKSSALINEMYSSESGSTSQNRASVSRLLSTLLTKLLMLYPHQRDDINRKYVRQSKATATSRAGLGLILSMQEDEQTGYNYQVVQVLESCKTIVLSLCSLLGCASIVPEGMLPSTFSNSVNPSPIKFGRTLSRSSINTSYSISGDDCSTLASDVSTQPRVLPYPNTSLLPEPTHDRLSEKTTTRINYEKFVYPMERAQPYSPSKVKSHNTDLSKVYSLGNPSFTTTQLITGTLSSKSVHKEEANERKVANTAMSNMPSRYTASSNQPPYCSSPDISKTHSISTVPSINSSKKCSSHPLVDTTSSRTISPTVKQSSPRGCSPRARRVKLPVK